MLQYIFVIWVMAHGAIAQNVKSYNNKFGPSLAPYSQLERHIQNEISKGTIVGTAVAVIENGEVSFIKAYGVCKKGEPARITTDTVFQLGSTSKPFTGSLFAIAAKQNRISLNSPTGIKGVRIDTQARHLLSHTSGFSRVGWNWQIEHGTSRSRLVDLFMKKTQGQPGQVFDYHNVAFSLLEELLQQAFSAPFNQAMKQHLLRPLGMTRTTVGFSEFKTQNNRAWPHEHTPKRQLVPSSTYSFRYHESVASSAGINASINDMAKFLKLQLGQNPTLIESDDLAPFFAPVVVAPDAVRWFKNRVKGDFTCHYGYGWRVLKRGDDQVVFHGGWLKGFTSAIAFSPKARRGIVVLSNAESFFSLHTIIDFFEGKF